MESEVSDNYLPNVNKNCSICLTKNNEIIILRCDHYMCIDCYNKIEKRRCPFCRTKTSGVKHDVLEIKIEKLEREKFIMAQIISQLLVNNN